MILFDAYPLIGWLTGEKVKDEVRDLLRRDLPATPAPILLEVFDFLHRRGRLSRDQVSPARTLLREQLTVIALDEQIAWSAAELRFRFYHRSTSPLSLPDCVLLASAISLDTAIATSDPPVADVARNQGLTVISVPDTQGRRP